MYIAKQIIMLVHIKPKTHPGGVQGALFSDKYHSELTAGLVKILPSQSPAKFKIKNRISLAAISNVYF
jgi:hypothetical protein